MKVNDTKSDKFHEAWKLIESEGFKIIPDEDYQSLENYIACLEDEVEVYRRGD